jgi:hypothetical protein
VKKWQRNPERVRLQRGAQAGYVVVEARVGTIDTDCVELSPIHIEAAPAAGLESSCNQSTTVGGLYAPL